MSEQIESKGVEELSKNVDKPNDALELINKIEKVIKNKKNNILMVAYQQDQGIIFKKFKTNNRFTNVISEFKISKTTKNFKIGIVKFVDRFSKMRISCISLFI